MKSTHRLEYRVLATIMSLVCLFSVLLGSCPAAFAEGAEYPENIELLFLNEPSENISITDEGKTADYTIPGNNQQVDVRLRISLNKKYEEGQLRIEIPYHGFKDRDGGDFNLTNKSSFLNQINSESSMLKLVEDNSRLSGDRGVIVLTNKASSALQLELDLSYIVTAYSVKDNGSQDFGITITDTVTGEDRSPDKITATFRTHVRNARLTKYTEDYGIDQGCYYRWDDMLEERYKLTSKYGIDEAAFKELCKEYDYVGYRLNCDVDANQKAKIYFNDQPEGGEVVAMSYRFTYKDCTPLDKETEGEHAGEWVYNGSTAKNFLCLVRYPKSVAENPDPEGDNPQLVNNATVTYVGIDGDEEDITSKDDKCISVWQKMGAIYHGDIWSVEKKSSPDPSGALDLLRAGKDATFTYSIAGIGKTYKYGVLDDFQYKDGPYWMEVVDDLLYVNGLGDDGKTCARLQPDDFHFKTFTMEVVHKDVTSVKLNNDVGEYTYRPIADREPVEVYVMTEDKPDVWQLDQLVSLPNGSSSTVYADENGETVFKFTKNNVYRIKFVYKGANGDIRLDSKVTGVLKGTGTTVKSVLDNMERINLENFQLFNWDGQMGYNGKGVWENPTDGRTIYASNNWVKEDLMQFDADNYEGHENTADSKKIATRLSASNRLTGIKPICGSAKTGTVREQDNRINGYYKLVAMTGQAASEEDLAQLIDLGVIKGGKEVVFHELLPVGMSFVSAKPECTASTYLRDDPKEYNWDKMWYQYSGHIHPIMTEEPEITYTVTDNYKGTLRQMVDITVKYPDYPIVRMGEHSDICYALASVVNITTRAEYADLRSSTLDNYVEAQFIDDNGKPVKLSGEMALPDDGAVYSDIKDRDGNNVFNDVDGDNDTKSTTVVAADCSNTVTMVYSATQIFKKIKADDFDTYFKDFTQTYAGHNYTYKLQFFTNKGNAKNVVIFDSIEEAYNESKYDGLPYWKGELYGVDIKEAEDAGFDKIKVYVNTSHYYTDEEIATNYAAGYEGLQPTDLTAANGWQQVDPDSYTGWKNVKTIAFSIGEDVEFGDSEMMPKSVSVYLKMKAPETIHPDQIEGKLDSNGNKQVLAYNAPAYYCEKKTGTTSWSKDTTIANVVTIGLKSVTEEVPAITKKYTGTELPDNFSETCTFNFKPVGQTPAPRSYEDGKWGDVISEIKLSLDNSGTAVADDNGILMFTEPGTYQYEITEKAGSKTGVTYSKAKYLVTYEVTDERKDVQYDNDVSLKVKKTIERVSDDEGKTAESAITVDKIEFNNDYTPVPVDVEIPTVIKKIEGDERPEEKEFTFALYPAGSTTATVPAPEKTIVTITGEGKASFGKVNFETAGEYVYNIVEVVAGGDTGYTYDRHVYSLKVTVTDVNGKLKAVKEMVRSEVDENDNIFGTEAVEADSADFINTYTPNPSETLAFPDAVKTFTGQQRLDDKEFSFTLSAVNGAPLPEKNTVTVKGAGKASFGEMSYTKAGTYVYTITEDDLDPGYAGYSKDNSEFTYTVKVVDNDGQLEASGELKDQDGTTVSAATFVNDYTPIPTGISAPVVIKEIKGDTHGNADKVFSFEMTSINKGPEPSNNIAQVKGDGKASSFGRISFTEPGVYEYVISEMDLPDDSEGYGKDDAVYSFTVTVTDNAGRLKAVSSLTKNGEPAEKLRFVNTYTPTSTEIEVPVAVKEVKGDLNGNDEKVFTFELTSDEDESEDIPMPESPVVTVTGSGNAEPFGKIVYTDVGTYNYTIFERELDDTHTGYTRDKSVYDLTVTVTDNNGKLEADHELTKNGEPAYELSFINDYHPLSTELELPVAVKEINGDTADTEDKEFVFEITGAEDVSTDAEDTSSADLPMPDPATASVTGAGTASAFGKITFDEAGTYTYEVFEHLLDDTYAGYGHDASVYVITVTVVDKDGQLEASYVMTKNGEQVDDLVFVNDYDAGSCELEVPVAVKKIEGDVPDDEDKVFTFEITSAEDESNPMPENSTATVTGEGKATAFGKITYNKVGTYNYDIFERDLDDSYIGYEKDTTVYRLTVTVKDLGGKLDASYKLTVNGNDSRELVFVNTYAPRPLDTDIDVIKVIEGATPEEDETYTFEITAKDGAPLPENNKVTVTGDGWSVSDRWTYTEPGVYVYEVREIAGDAENCKYDSRVYTVTDTVTDIGGELMLVTVKDGMKNFSRKITVDGIECEDIEFVNYYTEEEDNDDSKHDEKDESKPDDEDKGKDEEPTKPEDNSSKPDVTNDDSKGKPDNGDKDNDKTTTGDSSSKSENDSGKTDEGSKRSENDSSAKEETGDSSKQEETDSSAAESSKSDSSKNESKSTTTTTSNPSTGGKTLAGLEIVMLGAAICVLKKRKKNK